MSQEFLTVRTSSHDGKICKVCKTSKPLSDYHKHRGCKDGRVNTCKPCVKEYKAGRYKARSSEIKERMRKYYAANQDRIISRCKKYQKNNPHIPRAATAKRKAKLLSATPSWLTDKHREEINMVYQEAKRLELETNEPHHVDHIVPLQGKLVCGLHVPWNLRAIPARDNLTKHNKFIVK